MDLIFTKTLQIFNIVILNKSHYHINVPKIQKPESQPSNRNRKKKKETKKKRRIQREV